MNLASALIRHGVDDHLREQRVANTDPACVDVREARCRQRSWVIHERDRHRVTGERQESDIRRDGRRQGIEPRRHREFEAVHVAGGQLLDEQRVAPGAGDDRLGLVLRDTGSGMTRDGQRVGSAQRRDVDAAEFVPAEPIQCRCRGRFAAADRHHQSDPPGQQVEHGPRGAVGPLHIVDHQQPGADGGFDRGRHELGIAAPHRCVGAITQRTLERQERGPCQGPQRAAFEHGGARLAVAHRVSNERRLADTCLTDDGDPASSLAHGFGECGQFGLPADEQRHTRRADPRERTKRIIPPVIVECSHHRARGANLRSRQVAKYGGGAAPSMASATAVRAAIGPTRLPVPQ